MKGEKRVRRTNATIIKDIFDAVLNIVKEKGYMALSLNSISEYSNLSLITITNRFDSIDEIIDKFISRYDLWLEIFTEDLPENPTRESYQATLKAVFDIVSRKKPIQQLIAWQLTEVSPLLEPVIEYQNVTIENFLDKYSEAWKHPEYDVKMITALYLSAVLYVSSHKKREDFFGIDISSKDGLRNAGVAIRQMSDLFLDRIEKTKEKEIATKMLLYGDDTAKIVTVTGLTEEEIEELK